MFDPAELRDEFPILEQELNGRRLVYLDNAATTQVPRTVLDETRKFYQNKNSNVHRGIHQLSREAGEAYETARTTVAEFINATRPTEIVFTRGTTEAINLVAESFGRAQVSAGDRIVVTQMDHHSNFVPWQQLCEQKEARLKVVPVTDRGELDLAVLRNQLQASPQLLTLPYVSNVLGTVNPLEQITALAHEHDVPVLVDAAQAVQHQPLDVQKIDCDFLAFSGHKMYANPGIGVLYGKQHLLQQLPPYQSGGGMVDTVSAEATQFKEPPHKFEAGTTNYGGAVGLAAAIEFLEDVGAEEIRAHESQLLNYALEQLEAMDQLTVYGAPDRRLGVIPFNFEGIHPYDAGELLDELSLAVRVGDHCAQPLVSSYEVPGMIRASLGLYNTEADIDRLVEGLDKVREMLG